MSRGDEDDGQTTENMNDVIRRYAKKRAQDYAESAEVQSFTPPPGALPNGRIQAMDETAQVIAMVSRADLDMQEASLQKQYQDFTAKLAKLREEEKELNSMVAQTVGALKQCQAFKKIIERRCAQAVASHEE